MIGLFVSPILSGRVSLVTQQPGKPHIGLASNTNSFCAARERTLHNCKLYFQNYNDSDSQSLYLSLSEQERFEEFPTDFKQRKTNILSRRAAIENIFSSFHVKTLTALTHSNSFYIEKFEPR